MLKKTMLISSMLIGSVFANEKICTPYFDLINLNDDFKQSSMAILKSKIENEGVRGFVSPEKGTNQNAGMSKSVNLEWAKNNNCSHLLLTGMTRLGENVQVASKLLDVNSSEVVFNKLYKASGPDDLEPILSQLSSALSNEEFKSHESIYDVTNADASKLRQKSANTYYGGHFGGMYFADQNEGAFGFGVNMVWDNRSYFGEIDGSMYLIGNGLTSMTSASIALYKPTSDYDQSFYYGGGFHMASYSFMKDVGASEGSNSYYDGCNYSDEEKNGRCYTTESTALALLQGSVGYIIGRASTVNTRVQSDLKIGLATVGGDLPISLGFKVIVGFKN
jgi:hypothetical protein